MRSTVVNTYHSPMKQRSQNCGPVIHFRRWQQSEAEGLVGTVRPGRHKSKIQTQICLPQRRSFKPLMA